MGRLELSEQELDYLAEQLAEKVHAKLIADGAISNGRLAYVEKDAAALIGVAPHMLRDRRLKGQISASKVGRRWMYTRNDLLEFLKKTKVEATELE